MSSNPLRGVRTLIRRSAPYDIHHSASTRRHQSAEYSSEITITSLSDRASINRLLRPHAAEDYSNGPSSQNYELIDGHYYVTSDFFNLLIARFLHNLDQEANYMEEETFVLYVKRNLSMKRLLGHLSVDTNIMQAASNNGC
ncbi:hypothetical protein HAX54_000490 [Datura stramonium]|uniref:Uncharacterized protein n=1 Tax=Datura stramonium TaxID=4076 RepID=A0ABS8WSG1_DATST|nr:hypothetical protein [Datura stramonium]